MSAREKFVKESELSYSEWEHLIDEWIFSERDRAMLKRMLLDGITFEKLAEEFDLSVAQVKRIIPKAESQLFKHVTKMIL